MTGIRTAGAVTSRVRRKTKRAVKAPQRDLWAGIDLKIQNASCALGRVFIGRAQRVGTHSMLLRELELADQEKNEKTAWQLRSVPQEERSVVTVQPLKSPVSNPPFTTSWSARATDEAHNAVAVIATAKPNRLNFTIATPSRRTTAAATSMAFTGKPCQVRFFGRTM
jgi:hypothetical protein